MMHKFAGLLMGLGLMTSFVSCSDSIEDEQMVTPANARVMVVHASPDAPNVDVRANGNVALSNVPYLNNNSYSYLTVPAGTARFQVSPTGTTNYVIDAPVALQANMNYSVFAINPVASINAAVTMDNLATPAAGKAHVRFLHFGVGAPAVDITTEAGAVVFGNRSFNDQATNAALQNFTPVDAGTLNLRVRLAGTTTNVLSVNNVALQAGKIYTVFARGIATGTGNQALGASIIMHN